MQSFLQMRRIRRDVASLCSDNEKLQAVQPTLQDDSDESVRPLPHDDVDINILSCARRLEKEPINNSDDEVFVVGWDGPDDPSNPKNFSMTVKIGTTLIVALIAFVVGAASATDAAVLKQSSEEFHVSDVVGSFSTGTF